MPTPRHIFDLAMLALRDPTDETLIYTNEAEWLASAKAQAQKIRDPIAELHTVAACRYLYKNGKSIDLLRQLPKGIPYIPTVLVQHIFGIFDEHPEVVANRYMQEQLQKHNVWSDFQPDPDFRHGSIIVVLSDGDRPKGHIFRPSALRMLIDTNGQCPRPKPFAGWPDEILQKKKSSLEIVR